MSAANATAYANYLAKLRPLLAAQGQRLTICVAQWSAILNQYELLGSVVDRLLDMETYGGNSMNGWVNGDQYGGDYAIFLQQAGVAKAGVGLGGWNQTCGNGTIRSINFFLILI